MNSDRRNFIKKVTIGTAGITVGGSTMGMTAKSYSRIIGSNEKINVALVGLGRRVFAYYAPVSKKENNVEVLYLCDVMKKNCERTMEFLGKRIDYKPKLENDYRNILEDKNVDAVFLATPDHWHTPGAIMAMKSGKDVYVEKPCSHNMHENELIVAAMKKYNKVVQMGNQQRSSGHTIEIISEIHKGAIGVPYRAIAFYANSRDAVPVQKQAPVPDGLDWELWQGPAIRREYTEETWNYNWHWYGWNYGTAEAGNNATHELDVARWALQVDYPLHVDVQAAKRHFLDDGWEMYDTMDAQYRFQGDKIINWEGRSRNAHKTFVGGDGGRGTIIYGSDGSVYVDRGRYILYDRKGNVVKESVSSSNEAGTALGGGGDTSTEHVENWFNVIRGKENELNAGIEDASKSQAMVHYANIAYRIDSGFDIDEVSGKMYNRDAMKLWKREYAPGWEPTL